MALLKAALGFLATSYVNDAVVKPRAMGRAARAYCDRVGKPLLLVRGERMIDVVMGEPVKADVTQRRAYPVPYRSGQFGAVVAVNVLECLRRPDLALREWHRVADRVYVAVPSWWSPQAWLDPSHRWLVHPDMKRVAPLWTKERRSYLLRVSDNGYGGRSWRATPPSPQMSSALPSRSPSPSSADPSPSPSPSSADPSPSPSGTDLLPPPTIHPSEERAPQPEPYKDGSPALDPDLQSDPGPLSYSDLQPSDLESDLSSLSGLPRALTVVSTPGSGDD